MASNASVATEAIFDIPALRPERKNLLVGEPPQTRCFGSTWPEVVAVQNLQAFQPIEGAGLYPQLFEIAHYVGLHTLQAGLCNRKTVRRHAEGQQLGFHNAVVALGNLALQHFYILAPHFAVLVILHGDIDFVLAFRAAPVVDKGELERK